MMDDLINRQDAIDALDGEIIVTGRENAEAVRGYANLALDRIKRLPSAHPELDEWCTDCKEYDHERHCCPRYNRVIRETLEEISITRCKDCKHWKVSQNNTCGIRICYLFGGVREEYDYCSRGEKA